MQNYYQLLGINQNAETAEIKKAAQSKIVSLKERLAAIQNHAQQAEKKLILEQLQQIKTIYTVLNNPQQRQLYDSQLQQIEVPKQNESHDSVKQLLVSKESLKEKESTRLVAKQTLVSKESLLDDSPYQPPATPLSDFPDETELELAGRGARLIAHIIDNAILVIPAILFMVMIIDFGTINELLNTTPENGPSSLEQVFRAEMIEGMKSFGILLGLVYLIIFAINLVLLYRNGQTIGKYFLAIKIVKVDGSRAGLARIIFLRMLLFSLVSLIPVIGPLVYYLINPLFIFQESRRCLHDLVAGTMVVEI